uniref:S1 motif domain-containing protein n=1 Tax=Kalanchoe fedtschenkoi TaxID=63787 RepID=A0A7N0UCD9_KALFE
MPPTLFVPGTSFSLLNSFTPLHFHTPFLKTPSDSQPLKSLKTPQFPRLCFTPFCAKEDILTHVSITNSSQNDEAQEIELLDKPIQIPSGAEMDEVEVDAQKPDKEETLAPFLKFFKPRDRLEELEKEIEEATPVVEGQAVEKGDEGKTVLVEYFEPKPGDFVVGVVVSGNENKLDVNIGADLLGTMLTKEVLPLYDKEMDYLLFDMAKDAEEFMANGKMGVVSYEDVVNCEVISGRPVLEAGSVVFAEVLGRTLSGRPLLSARRLFRRISWHRARQIKQLNEPIEVRITEWNTGGLLTRIEGLRSFLPKGELMNRVTNLSHLKEYVGRRMYVQITRIDENCNDLIVSEKQAWEALYLKEGTLIEGTVKQIYPYGAQIRIQETNRSGLLHISNISQGRVSSVSDLFTVGEKVKVLIVKSIFHDKISLSIADLESEPGLFISNKEKVFAEAEEMAKKYKQKLPKVSATTLMDPTPSTLLCNDEASMYANWNWFTFERDEAILP